MLDIKVIREREQDVRQAMDDRAAHTSLDDVIELDARRRAILAEVEQLKNRRNVASKEIGRLKKAGQDTSAAQAEMRDVGNRISTLDEEEHSLDVRLAELLLSIPNMPHASVPVGADETGNRVVRVVGDASAFDYPPQSHVDIAERLGIIDFARAARMTGAGFALFRGVGARLERALIQFMIDLHVNEHGYEEVSPPFLCNGDAMTGTGQLPKMAEDMYHIPSDGLYLVPTAEVPVTNMYRDEIIQEPLPIRHVAYTPCFRREAGAAGRETRGLIRVHQFDKVELVKFVAPAASYEELEQLVKDAEVVLQRLELHYRVKELCTGDLSFAAAKCYDIELWAPGQNAWLEVSSCSNFEDFQARRAKIRYRNAAGKVEFVHTLNGSGVALPRLMVAILENYQQADGSVVLPDAIRPYLGGLDRIRA